MKNILSAIIIGVLALTMLIAFVACGGKTGDELENGMTSMMDDATTLMEEVSTALDDLADDLTEDGNVTDETATDESTTKDSLLGDTEINTTTVAE